jgi:hypothetical protein
LIPGDKFADNVNYTVGHLAAGAVDAGGAPGAANICVNGNTWSFAVLATGVSLYYFFRKMGF